MNFLEALWVLQQLELKESELKQQKSNNEIARILRKIKQDIEDNQNNYAVIKEQYLQVENGIKQLDFLIQEAKGQIKKLERKLMDGTVTNKKEISGMENRISNLKDKVVEMENDQIKFLEQYKVLKEKLIVIAKDLKIQREEFYEQREKYLKYVEEISQEINEILDKKEEIAKKIDVKSIELFAKMKEKFKDPIAEVERGICRGCNIKLTVDKIRALKRGDEMQKCDKCGRVIFIKSYGHCEK
ncbi:MAG: hypothetical protein LRZ91_02385 [Desulfotomaculum sp.]|nr:hypothetical protein [Desulfotomaculum sp.]